MPVNITFTDDKMAAMIALIPDKSNLKVPVAGISEVLNTQKFSHFNSTTLIEKTVSYFNQNRNAAIKFRVYCDQFLELEQYFEVKIANNEMLAYINVNILSQLAEKVTYDFLKRLLMKNGVSSCVLINDLQKLADMVKTTPKIEKYLVASGQQEVMAVDGAVKLHELFTRSEKIVRVVQKGNLKKQMTSFAVITTGALPAGTRLLTKFLPVDGKAGLTITNKQVWSEQNKKQVIDPVVAVSKNITARKFSDRIEYISSVRGIGYFIDNRIIEVDEVFDGEFLLSVSDNKMQLLLSLQSPKGGKAIEPEQVKKAIGEMQIKAAVDYELVESEIKKINLGAETKISRIVIAKGIEPVNGLDGEIEWKTNLEQFYKPAIQDNGSVDYRGGQCFPFVREGVAAGIWFIATRGISTGMDILGTPIEPDDGKGINIQFDKAFTLEDGEEKGRAVKVLIPKLSGLLKIKKEHMSVDPVFEVNTVDYTTGNLDFDGTLIIKETIIDGFTVRSTNDIHIKGNVGACTIESDTNIFIHGGMNGRGTGIIKAKGNVHIKFAENCRIQSGESIYIVSHTVLSSLISAKNIIIGINRAKGKIVGSRLFAWQLIETNIVGTDSSSTDSTLHIGINKELYDFVENKKIEIETLKIEISKLQNKISKPGLLLADQIELAKGEMEEKIKLLNEDIVQCQEMEGKIYNENPDQVLIKNEIQAHTKIFICKIDYELILNKEKVCFKLDKNKIIQEQIKSSK